MTWEKIGLIFNPSAKLSWSSHTALQPTPIMLNDEVIRIFFGSRDGSGVSRVGWVDVSSTDPSKIIGYADRPALDVGLPGAFDDNGVVPSAVVRREGKLYLYYAGYQLQHHVRFIVLGGLAVSEDNGVTFKRIQNTPVLERTSDEFLFRVLHTALFENGVWKVWYGGGNHFITWNGKTLPVYDIRYMESQDGIHFPEKGIVAISNAVEEHRVGRPYVTRLNGMYYMFFGASTKTSPYRLAYATSQDGQNWERNNELDGITYRPGDFDSEMSAYPSVIQTGSGVFMFYNGNNYGKMGIGLARLKG